MSARVDSRAGRPAGPAIRRRARTNGYMASAKTTRQMRRVGSRNNSDEMALLSRDTIAEIEQLQIARWRQMSPAEKLRMVSDI
jgi:hypothetical protein